MSKHQRIRDIITAARQERAKAAPELVPGIYDLALKRIEHILDEPDNGATLLEWTRLAMSRTGEAIRGPNLQFHYEVPAPYVDCLRGIVAAIDAGRAA